ncbi:hypothetical protein CKAN_02127800 [Cinnamomum micranthum f. kanehirae]|uniref:Uncharacterized protein n=1 Tax=Cinnamomum micranthum f. kanehirae TaxID=337451 RepID=A0A3S3NH29_9MAGN|nr:hypothetical protein CKAN_02127800 [Cinnamomum micranthum f. kanehirae]
MAKLEKLVFVDYNMRLRARNLTRRDNEDYQPINLDYIFEEDNPLNEWLAEREDPVLNDTIFLNEAMADTEDFQLDEGQNSPPQRPTRRSATPTSTEPSTCDTGKGVAASSS